MDLAQDVVHRIADRPGHRAVDRRGRGLVLQRAGVRSHAPRGDRAATQRPEKPVVPVFADRLLLDIRKRARDALVGVVHGAVERSPVLGAQSIFLVPDVQGRFLEWNAAGVPGCKLHGGAHFGNTSPIRRSFIGKKTPSFAVTGLLHKKERGAVRPDPEFARLRRPLITPEARHAGHNILGQGGKGMQRLPVRQPFLLVRCDAAKLFSFSDLYCYFRVLLQCLNQRIRQDLFAPKTLYIVFTALPPLIHSLSRRRATDSGVPPQVAADSASERAPGTRREPLAV